MAREPVTLGRHWDREAKGAGGRHVLVCGVRTEKTLRVSS